MGALLADDNTQVGHDQQCRAQFDVLPGASAMPPSSEETVKITVPTRDTRPERIIELLDPCFKAFVDPAL